MHEHTKDRIKQFCEMMGEDINSPACQEVMDHLKSCPTCKVYYDTIKKTVLLCREIDCAEKVPEDVRFRLMKVLDLEEFQPK